MPALDALSDIGAALNPEPGTSAQPTGGAAAALSDIGAALGGTLEMPNPAPVLPPRQQMREEPFTDPMSGQVLGTQMAPVRDGPGPLVEPTKFALTAGARGLGGLADFAADPLYIARYLVSPELAQAERKFNGPVAAPGSAAADAFFKGTGIPESKPESTLGRLALAGAEGLAAGGPFGLVPAALSAAGGVTGQGTMELTDNPRLAAATSLATMMAGGAGARLAGEHFRPVPEQAASRIARRGPDINAISEAFAAPEAQGKPLAIADVANPAVQGLGEVIANRPGPGAKIAEDFLNNRDAGAGPRLLGDLNDAMGGAGPSAQRTAQTLANQRSLNATPLYDQARAANPAMASPEIDAVLQTPNGKAALEHARVKMANDGQEIPPKGPLDLRTLDYVKRALDDQIGAKQRAGERDDVRILSGLKNRLLNAIDNADATAVRDADGKIVQPGAYKQARDSFSGHSQSMSAVEDGASIFNKLPEQIADEVVALSPGDKQFYLIGARDALAQRIAKTSTGGNEALRIVGNQHIQNQLRPLFNSDAEFNSFIGRAQLESAMYRTKQNTIGNSRTFRRAANEAADEGGGMGSAMENAIAGIGMMHGQPLAALPAITRALRSAAGWLNRPSPEVDAQIARMLYSGEPAQNARALEAIRNGKRPAGLLPLMAPGLLSPLLTGERGR